MKPTFVGINHVITLQYTYCDYVEENIMFVHVDVQTDKEKNPQEMMMMFTKEQILDIYESMLRMEESNHNHLK